MTPVSEAQNYINLTATTTVSSNTGALLGIFCSSASATPTIQVQDGSTTIVSAFTPVGGTFYPIPARFSTSLVITISGTVDATAFWSP